MPVLLVLSLVMVGVAVAAAADLPQTPRIADLNGVIKISDQEGRNIRGTGLGFPGYQFNNPGIFSGINCPQSQTCTMTPIQDQTRLQLRDFSCKQ